MSKISIATYSIRIKKKNTKNEYQKVKELKETTLTFKEYVNKRLLSLDKKINMNNSESKVVRIIKNDITDNKCQGIVEVGEYGYTSNLYDIDKHEMSYNRSISDAELIPYFFCINLDEQSDIGYLLVQRFGSSSIKTPIAELLSEKFHDYFPNYTLKINQIVLKEIAQKYINEGRLLQVSFINYNLPSDLADSLEVDKSFAEESHAELVIKSNRRGVLPFSNKLKQAFTTSNENLFEISSFKYDTIKVKVELDNVIRTIGIEDEGQIRSYFDISEYIEYGDDGHPTYDSIKKESDNILKELIRRNGTNYE